MHQKRPIHIKIGLQSLNTWVSPVVYALCQKRHIYVKRDLYASKETETHRNRPAKEAYRVATHQCHLRSMCYVKRDIYTSKETYTLKKTYVLQNRLAKEAYRVPTHQCHLRSMCYVKRDMIYVKRDIYTSKETSKEIHLCHLRLCQKRHIYVKRNLYTSKETYTHQKRPAKETYRVATH